jgi:hypothetical protein
MVDQLHAPPILGIDVVQIDLSTTLTCSAELYVSNAHDMRAAFSGPG